MPTPHNKTTPLLEVRNDFLNSVVKQLVQRRHALNITQDQLNYELGVADRLVSKWECGLRTPNSFNLYCWADALGTKLTIISKDPNDYLTDTENQTLQAANDNNEPLEGKLFINIKTYN